MREIGLIAAILMTLYLMPANAQQVKPCVDTGMGYLYCLPPTGGSANQESANTRMNSATVAQGISSLFPPPPTPEQQLAKAQADLARAQAEAIRQQTEANERQQALQLIGMKSDSELRAAANKLESAPCGAASGIDCASRELLKQAIRSELERRQRATVDSEHRQSG